MTVSLTVETVSTESLDEVRSYLESRAPQPHVERRRVLVVEDDPAQRELFVTLVTDWGYDVVAVGSAEEAEFSVRRRGVDAAIVDVFLPGRSGESLMGRLRERFPELVMVGISALGDAAMARRCKVLGADLFLTKPITAEDLSLALAGTHTAWH